MEKIDKNTVPINHNEIRLFLVGRNEMLRLPYLIKHYRNIGVDRFFIVDNGSTDNTIDFLLSQKDIHVFYTEDSYKENLAGIAWVNNLLDQYGFKNWCLIVDADEILVYPYSEFINIHKLCSFLDEHKATGLFTLLLDMYPNGPLSKAIYTPEKSFFEVANYFDNGPYHVFPAKNFPHLQIRGGVRRRLFWENANENAGPALNKVPLVKWTKDMKFTGSTHTLKPYVTLAPITGALLHFKYFSDFAENAMREYKRNDRPFIDEYRLYAEMMEKNPDTSFLCSESTYYDSSYTLVQFGLMRDYYIFRQFAKKIILNSNYSTKDKSVSLPDGVFWGGKKTSIEKSLQILPLLGG